MAHVWRPELDLSVSTQSALLKVMSDAARKAARGLNRDFGELGELQVSRKAPADFVSAADLKAEQTLFEALEKARPGYSFMGEERKACADAAPACCGAAAMFPTGPGGGDQFRAVGRRM